MKDNVVLITGGAGNLGQAVTCVFLEAGARVAVPLYRTDSPSALDQLGATHPGKLQTFALDLTTERGSEHAVRQVVEWGGKLNSVVHLVGGYSGGKLIDMPLESWTRMVNLNMTSAFLVARFAIPKLIAAGGGSFVFVSSRAGVQNGAGHVAYAAAKAGLIRLSEAIAEEYEQDGIRSNVVLPDKIDTIDNRRAEPDADYSTWTSPDAIGRIIYFLASPGSKPISGASLPVYGA